MAQDQSLVLAAEGSDIAGEDEQKCRKIVGNNGIIILIVRVNRAQLKDPIGGVKGGSLRSVEVHQQLTRLGGVRDVLQIIASDKIKQTN